MKPLRIAADTNVLLDLADEVEFVLDALAVIEERLSQPDKIATPSVLEEIGLLMRFRLQCGASPLRPEGLQTIASRTSFSTFPGTSFSAGNRRGDRRRNSARPVVAGGGNT